MVTLVYLLGFSYSGSTLLARLLSNHSQIATTGEIVGPPHFAQGRPFECSCGAPIRQCPFYGEIERRTASPHFSLARNVWNTRVLQQPSTLTQRIWFAPRSSDTLARAQSIARTAIRPCGAHLARVQETYRRFIGAACDVLKTSILVDSSKVPVQLLALRNVEDVSLKVIHLVRHPAACALSSRSYHGHTPRFSAVAWRANYRDSLESTRGFSPEQVLRIRYEDLCADVPKVLSSACAFIGVPYQETMLHDTHREEHIVGNPMRLARIGGIRENTKWKTELSARDIHAVMRVVRKEAKQLGYDTSTTI